VARAHATEACRSAKFRYLNLWELYDLGDALYEQQKLSALDACVLSVLN
jgi:hypothetical protein